MEGMKGISPGKWEGEREEPKRPDNYKAWRSDPRRAAGFPGWPHCRLLSQPPPRPEPGDPWTPPSTHARSPSVCRALTSVIGATSRNPDVPPARELSSGG